MELVAGRDVVCWRGERLQCVGMAHDETENDKHGVQVPMSKHETRPEPEGAPSLEMGIQSHLGRSLRRVYDQTLTEPIPDRFLSLMNALEAIEPAQEEAQPMKRPSRAKAGATAGAARSTERRA